MIIFGELFATISFKRATDLQIDHGRALAEAVMVLMKSTKLGIGRARVLKRRPAYSQGRDGLEDGLDAVLRPLDLVVAVPGVTGHLLQLEQAVAVGMLLTVFEQPWLLPFHHDSFKLSLANYDNISR